MTDGGFKTFLKNFLEKNDNLEILNLGYFSKKQIYLIEFSLIVSWDLA